MLVAALILLGTAWIGDDAFITLRVIDNFVNGYGLRYNVIERVQVFTHPLWLLLLTPFYALTREPMVTTMLVSVALSLCALWLLAARIARDVEYGCLLVLAAVASRAICSFSTSGLENPLTFLLLAVLVWQLSRSERAWIPAAISGLLLLNRLDLAVLVGPVVVYLMFRARGADRAKVILAAMVPALAWIVFSVIYYGAPFPNTAYAKLGTGFSTGMLVLRGLEYTREFVLTDPLLALIIVMGVFVAGRSRNWPTMLLGIGIVLYVAYTIMIGGDFMSGRFFASPGFLAICILAQMPVPQLFIRRRRVASLLFVGVLGYLFVTGLKGQPTSIIASNGIADERRFYFSKNGLIPVIKEWVATGSEPVHPWGQKGGVILTSEALASGRPIIVVVAGMSGYYAGPSVHILDAMALTDAFLARLPATPGARVGHYQRMLPRGYADTSLDANPTTWLKVLRPLLNDVTLATRAPLLAKGRYAAIWRLLSGQYSWVYETDLTIAR